MLFCPGYVLAWTANLFDFRGKLPAERAVWAVALSVSSTPIFAELCGKYLSLSALCWIFLAFALAFVAVTSLDLRAGMLRGAWGLGRSGRIALAGLFLWTLIAILELIDIPSLDGKRLFINVVIYDHSVRTAFVDAVLRTGVPPASPLYWPGHAAPMRYYYFWYILCAAVSRLGHIGPRQALIASCAWSGFALCAAIALFCRYFLASGPLAEPLSSQTVRRQTLIGMGLLLVTGLDLFPFLAYLLTGKLLGDLEWWSWDQFTSWFDTFIWAPHHAAGLVCCLTGFLLIWIGAPQAKAAPRTWLPVFLAGIAFASAFGLSIWIALGFAILLAGWIVSLPGRNRVAMTMGAGLVAVLLLAPFLRELRAADPVVAASVAPRPYEGGEGPFLTLGARPMIPPDTLKEQSPFAELWRTHPWLEQQIAILILMPFGFELELGFFGLALLFAWSKRSELDSPERTALGLTLGCLLLTSFVRSAVIANNDFGVRVSLFAQFFLLLLATRFWDAWPANVRRLAAALVAVGVLGTLVQILILRTYLPIMDALHNKEVVGIGERAASLRLAFSQMNRKVPSDAVIAYLPEKPDYYNFVQTIYLNRQAVSELPQCNTAFGGSKLACPGIQRNLATIYSGISGREAQSLCRDMNATYLVATRWDEVWQKRGSWAWTLPATVATDAVRVMSCSAQR